MKSERLSFPAVAAWFVLGLLTVLVFGGESIGKCLGPLGVTVVGCARGTGAFPTNGPGLTIAAIWLVIGTALALAADRPSRRWLALVLVAAVLALPVGKATYRLTRPMTLEGPAYLISGEPPGEYLVLAWPYDPEIADGYALFAGATVFAIATVARFASSGRRRSLG